MSLRLCTAAVGIGSLWPSAGFDLDLDASSQEPQQRSRYTPHKSGWPTALDWGIYWFGPGDQSKKARPRQQTKALDPRTWFLRSGRNATEEWKENFYDPSHKTVIYMDGWSGSRTWDADDVCERSATRCRSPLCPEGLDRSFAEPWIKRGWNVGFLYWDQFADEPCTRDAEQKIWFDRDGEGLRWASYAPQNQSLAWKAYSGPEYTVTDLCVTAVKEAMGDFYSGQTVRFVGRSIGAQLAVSCAARLHHQGHVAAPQRLTLLEPFFTATEFNLFGTSVRCGKVTTDDGPDDYAREATANFVKMLWLKKKVATEVYASAEADDGLKGKPFEDMRKYALRVVYRPSWCSGGGISKCKHHAVLPLYFLSYDQPAPRVEGRELEQSNRQPQSVDAAVDGSCEVPAASCSDSQVRALVEAQLQHVHQNEVAALPETRWVWLQNQGQSTFSFDDNLFSFSGGAAIIGVTPDPTVEDEVRKTAVISQRDWGLSRRWHLGHSAGLSFRQLQAGLCAVGGVVVVLMLAGLAYHSIRFAYERCVVGSDEDDEDCDGEEEDTGSSCADEKESMMP